MLTLVILNIEAFLQWQKIVHISFKNKMIFPLSKNSRPIKKQTKSTLWSCRILKTDRAWNQSASTLLCLCLTLMLGLLSTLKAQESRTKLDAIDEEFSGPLAVIPEMVSVGDANNVADPLTGLGAVEEPFQIGKYDVTVFQWSVFLTAVHAEEGNLQDPRDLFHQEMLEGIRPTSYLRRISGIVKKNIREKYDLEIYEEKETLFFPQDWGTKAGHYYGSLPMTGISINDAKRYVNWLNHGCPTFTELNDETLAYTETGAYDFTHGKQGDCIPGASFYLPTLAQWYKAAYYQAFRPYPGYWRYPTQGNELPKNNPYEFIQNGRKPKLGANYATFNTNSPHLKFYYCTEGTSPLITPVGLFQDSPGGYGTYDMGGNVRQWTGDFFSTKKGEQYIAPGGSYDETSDQLLSTHATKSFLGSTRSPTIGLRICFFNHGRNSDSKECMQDTNNPQNNTNSLLFPKILTNLAIAQITTYGLEMALDVAIKRVERGEWISITRMLVPFTLQRNIVNTLLTVILAATETGEVSMAPPIKKADSWTIGCIIASTATTMILTEGSAFIFEAFVGKTLAALGVAGVTDTLESSTWARFLTNVYYIGIGTYNTTESDLEYFNEQQRKQKIR